MAVLEESGEYVSELQEEVTTEVVEEYQNLTIEELENLCLEEERIVCALHEAIFRDYGLDRMMIHGKQGAAEKERKTIERYSSLRGKTVGCSNVELDLVDEMALEHRKAKIDKIDSKIVLGTIGGYGLKTKGQILVIIQRDPACCV